MFGTCLVSSEDFSLVIGILRTSKRLKMAEINSYYIKEEYITVLTAYLAILNAVEAVINDSCHLRKIPECETLSACHRKISG